MQIVIDISDKVYGLLKYFEKAMGLIDKKEDDDIKTALMRAVVNGTPLPKGHGRLIDADALIFNVDYNEPLISKRDFDFAPTIVEADKAESEDKT